MHPPPLHTHTRRPIHRGHTENVDTSKMLLNTSSYLLWQTLSSNPATGKFQAQFQAPDSYGVFKFRVMYRRPGYSVIHAETQVSIRPFKHNEYERFIFSAYPYYSSALSGLLAFFVFVVVFVYSDDDKDKDKGKEKVKENET